MINTYKLMLSNRIWMLVGILTAAALLVYPPVASSAVSTFSGGDDAILGEATPEAEPAPQGSGPGNYRFYVRNWTRVSTWDFFDPGPTGGDPNYSYVANRLRVGVQWQNDEVELHAAVQGVQFAKLPGSAAGPGPLGLGAVYRGHGGGPHPGSVYIRYLYMNLKDIGETGLSFRFGRMGFTGGAEGTSDRGKINRVRGMRVGDKLVGEFGWSLFQRSFDGGRADWDHGFGRLTIGAFQPTQGGFEERAGVSIDEIKLYTAAWTLLDNEVVPNNEVQAFFYNYNDERPITAARPDNSGLSTGGLMNLDLRTVGFHAIGAYEVGGGELDTLGWYAYQTGSWFNQRHRAQAMAAEIGYQWNVGPRPWLRAGYLRGTGDEDPTDDKHGTFFQMLPTTRLYALTTAYNLMNNTDLFVQALLAPPNWSIRADYHHVGLSNSMDRAYFGAGATQAKGTVSGYGARPSGGENDFGDVFEIQATRTINSHWSITGYYSHIVGGKVVQANFPGSKHFNFAYIENAFSF